MHFSRLGVQREKVGRGTERLGVVGARRADGFPGGLGDLGRPIVDALFESGNFEVYSMSRKVEGPNSTFTSLSLVD